MNSSIEHLGRAVALVKGQPVLAGSSVGIPAGALVHVCQWCDGHREATQALLVARFHVSHGICQTCAAEVMAAKRASWEGVEIFA